MSNILIRRIATVFGHPDFADDPAGYLAEINRLIGHYSEPVLEHAANKLIREHTPTQRNPWPSPATIAQACAAALPTWGVIRPAGPGGEWSSESVAKAYDLLKSPMGRAAASDGWILGLWDFCRKNGRLPGPKEVGKVRDGSQSFDDNFAEATRIKTPLGDALVKLGETMLARRHNLAQHAHGMNVDRENFEMSDTSKRMTGERDDQ